MEKYYIYIGLIVLALTLLLNQMGSISHYLTGVGLGIGIALELVGAYKIRRK